MFSGALHSAKNKISGSHHQPAKAPVTTPASPPSSSSTAGEVSAGHVDEKHSVADPDGAEILDDEPKNIFSALYRSYELVWICQRLLYLYSCWSPGACWKELQISCRMLI